jgi:hypothetical protein
MQSVVTFCALSSASQARLLHQPVCVLLSHMHVDLGRVQIGMAQPILQLIGTHAALGFLGGKGMAEGMRTCLLG